MTRKRLIGTGQVTMVDTTDSRTIIAYIGSTLQRQVVYNPDNGRFSPNYGATPIELVAELFEAGDVTNRVNDANSITWYRQDNSMGPLVEIHNDDTYQIIGGTLKIKKNVLENNNSMNYQVKIKYPINTPDGEEELIVNADIELVKLSSGAAGESAIFTTLNLPDGDVIRNHDNNLTIRVEVFKGSNIIEPSDSRWYQLDPKGRGDVVSGPGWRPLNLAGQTIVVTPDMFKGTGTFMSVVTIAGKHYRNTTTIRDIVDTTVTIIGPSAFKNGKGSITLTAKVYDVGEEIDNSGTNFIYEWSSYDTQGNLVQGFNRIGKTITISASDVDNIVSLQCIVTKR